MTRAQAVMHIDRLAHLLMVRGAEKRDPLFSLNIGASLKSCHFALRAAMVAQDEVKFLKIMNEDLYRALETSAPSKNSCEINENSLSLRGVICELKELGNLGASGIFCDKEFKLTVLLNKITEKLEERERLLIQILQAPAVPT
jgi:hypothetical protein